MTSPVDEQELQLVREFFSKWINMNHSSVLRITKRGVDFGLPGQYHYLGKHDLLRPMNQPTKGITRKTIVESSLIQQQIQLYAEDVTQKENANRPEETIQVDKALPWEEQVQLLCESVTGKSQSKRQSFDGYYQLAQLLEARQEFNELVSPGTKAKDEYKRIVGNSAKYTLRIIRRTHLLFNLVGKEQIPKLSLLTPRTLERMTSSNFEKFMMEVKKLLRSS